MKYFFLASAFVASAANAAGTPVPLQNLGANQFFWQSTGVGIQTLSLDTHGTRLVTSSADYLSVSNGALNVNRGGQLALRSGVYLPVTTAAKVPGAVMGAMVKKALSFVPYLATGYALYELAKELGFIPTKNADGTVTVQKIDPEACTGSANCTFYTVATWDNSSYFNNTRFASSTKESACTKTATDAASRYIQPNTLTITNWANCSFTVTGMQNGSPYTITKSGWGYGTVSVPPTGGLLPSSQQELIDAISNKQSWPDGSKIASALDQAQRLTGDQITTQNPKISGPASVTGPSTTTKTPTPTGTKETTSQDTFDCHYNDPSYDGTIPGTVVCTQKTTTTDRVTTTDPQTGQTTTTTTQTSETTKPADITPQEETAPTDTANPDLPKLYERKYPDGLTGVWTARKAELTSSSLLSLLRTMTPTISSSGGCPQFTIPASIGPLSFGSGFSGPPCYIWDFCKVVVLLSAAFLARALIFGG